MNHVEDLRGRILEYLRTRKHAAETAEGINRVWLERPPRQHIAEVEYVLDDIASEGLLVKHVLPGPVGLYYLPDPGDCPSRVRRIAGMFTSLFSTSQALSGYLRQQLENLPTPGLGFGGGGSRVVSINSPHEMREEMKQEGLSVWLYRIDRDEMRLNFPTSGCREAC